MPERKQMLVIEVRGGVVQEVYTDEELRVCLIDWDDGSLYEPVIARRFPTARLAEMPDDTAREFDKYF